MITRPRLVAAPVAVVAVVATALLAGGQDDPGPTPSSAPTQEQRPRIVSEEEFCAAFGRLAAAQQSHLAAASTATVVELKASATDVGDLAPGTAMPDDAQAGVDYVVTAFLGLPDDATAQDVVESDDGATLSDDAHAQALAAYVTGSCRRPEMSSAR